MTVVTGTPSSTARTVCCCREASAPLFRNQPMNAIQSPPKRSPPSTREAPHPIMPNATACPTYEASRVARARLPVVPHRMDRSTRPPSRGKPGTRLNAANSRLVKAR